MLATGTFNIKLSAMQFNLHLDSDTGVDDRGMFSHLLINKRFEGDLEGLSVGQMLSTVTPTEGSAGYVAMERVTATLHGRAGSFVLQHTGLMDRGSPQLTVTVVPDSGTDALAGLRGQMKIVNADGKHSYEFDYTLDSIS